MRKNLLDDLVGEKPELTAVNSDAACRPSRCAARLEGRRRGHVQGSGADDLGPRRRRAALRDVVEIDTALIVDSAFRDRLEGAGDSDELVASIREAGQQVPILVRPHPTERASTRSPTVTAGWRRCASSDVLCVRSCVP